MKNCFRVKLFKQMSSSKTINLKVNYIENTVGTHEMIVKPKRNVPAHETVLDRIH